MKFENLIDQIHLNLFDYQVSIVNEMGRWTRHSSPYLFNYNSIGSKLYFKLYIKIMINNNQQPSQLPSQLQNIAQQPNGSAASGRQHLRLGDGKQSSQSSSGNGRTHRAILSQGNELQMQYANAMPLGGMAHGSADNEDGAMLVAPQGSSDLNKTHQNYTQLAAQPFSQGAARKGQAQLNSSRPNPLHPSSFLDSKNIIAPHQPDQLGQSAGMTAQGVARLTNNQNWMQGANQNHAPPSHGSAMDPAGNGAQKSQSQQKQREANTQSREEEQPQNNPTVPPESTNLPMPHQNPQFMRSLGRGSHPLGVGSVNSNSTATMTVATALSVHNSSDRQASLPVAKQSAPQPAALPAYQQPGPPPPQKQPYQHILQQNQQKDLQYTDNGTILNPLKGSQIPQSSGRMKEQSVAGSSVIGSEALSRISGHAGLANGNKANGIKESRSPQMVMSTLLYAPGSDVQNHLNETHNSGNAFPNLGGVPNTNQSLQHKTPQIQLPSLLQHGAAANVTQGQASNSVSKAKSYQRAAVNYTYSHMKSPSASQADRDPYADRRNIQTGSLFQIRNKTTHSSINSGRKQIFSKSYATREQIGHASGSAGFANMTRSIEIHEVTNSVERDRRESAESVEGNFFPEPMDADIKGRYEQNSRERRLRSLGGKPLSSDNYEITTQSQNDRINRLMSKKTSLPLENNVNHNNVLSTANSEQLPTLSPNRQTTKNAQVAGSAHLNNILSTLKKPAMVNGIITDHENLNKSVSPNYPLKQSLQQQKTIPIYANNGLSQTPVAAGAQNNGLAMQGPHAHGPGQGPPQPFKPNAIKLTQARPPQVPVAQHLSMPVVTQNQGALPLPPSQQAQQPQPQDTSKLQLPAPQQAEDASAAQKTFDFHYVKILLRQSSSHSHSTSQKKGATGGKPDGQSDQKQETFKEILLEREWLKKNRGAIPHFSEVISKVKETEGVEITMNCNSDAFYWLIDIVKIQTNYTFEFVKKNENGEPIEEMSPKERDFRVQEKFFEITPENCLNKLVTSHFLQIKWIYEQIWQQFFLDNFPAVINSCKISLSNLNSEIVAHIAERVSDGQLEKLKDRRDKFLSNLYRARIEQKLLRYCSSKRAFQITDHSIFYCEDCQKILTLKQSRRISCALEGNEERAFVDANGDLFVAHKFCDLNLQTDNYRVNQSSAPASNSTAAPPGQQAPIDMAQFIRFFRERYRLCWKEIYLKFASISRNYEPEFCTKCCRWFRFCDFAGCPVGSDPSYGHSHEPQDQLPLRFHTVDHRTSLNNVTPEDILNYKRQIQVINDLFPQRDIERMMKVMKERDKMKFVEPQSMNFEKKLSEAYLDFRVAMDKKAARQRTEKEPKPRELPIVENEFEDLLFQGAQAQANIHWQLRGEPDLLKKFQKDAKAYVRDHPQGQNQSAVVDRVGECELDGYSGGFDKVESREGKRKLSPRSMMRVNKLVRKRIVALKRETVTDDDAKSMNVLIQSLRMQRTEAEAKKDKSMKKDKTLLLNGLLEENQSHDRAKDLLTDIKIVKSQQQAFQQQAQQKKGGKVLSDISQITQQQKKRNKKNQNSFSALCQQAAQSTGNKPPTNPQYTTSKGDKEASTTANKDKESNRVAVTAAGGQASSREKPNTHSQHQTHAPPVESTPHTSTTQSSQRHAHITVPVREQQQQQMHGAVHGGNYHLHVWDARDKFKHLPQQPQHNIQHYQNGRSNSQNPSQMKVHNTSTQQHHAANIARSNSICSNDRGNTIQQQQFQFQHLQQKKDSSHNVNVNGTQIYPRQKSSQASSKNIVGRTNPSSFNIDQ